jgi:hypothetical protein
MEQQHIYFLCINFVIAFEVSVFKKNAIIYIKEQSWYQVLSIFYKDISIKMKLLTFGQLKYTRKTNRLVQVTN